MREKLKKLFEVLLAVFVAVPICVAMIVGAYGLFFIAGIFVIIVMIVIVPIAIVINAVMGLTGRKITSTTITIREENFDDEEDEFENEEDL
ncbi:MAG: hypothetical protein NC548_56660 [Lachnospiraceae bacterium]|nr:hypothetical protein [Lachnospiraceae bacterium]